MKHSYDPKRRGFLKLSAGLACLSMTGMELFPRLATAATVNDYKALVCIYLNGGNDGNNLIVPQDAGRYASYKNIRGSLALGNDKLLTPIVDSNGSPYALHYGLTEINNLFSTGQLAIVLNTGMLESPLTRAQYLQGVSTIPSNLFSHSDQTVQVQTGQPTTAGKGWGGSLLDNLGGSQDSMAAVSLSSPALLLQGQNVSGNLVPPGSNLGLAGMEFWDASITTARKNALDKMLALDAGNPLRQAANLAMKDGLQLGNSLKAIKKLAPIKTVFPGTSIGRQLEEVINIIRLRMLSGNGRQVFFCSLDGFDTHSGQDWQQWDLFKQLSKAMEAFYFATVEIGLDKQVTSFTQSEFGRTLQSNGSGSDHAWGSHQVVLGGAVRGGIYGQLPDFTLNGVDDANGRGVWIPKIATAQFAATLGRWFGASTSELATVFPNLGQFSVSDIGFMG
jgi:uncharacterized protein (DUF1501 family)